MSKNSSVEEKRAGNTSESVEEEVLESHILTQQTVNEQIKGFIAPLTRQLGELTRLVHGMVPTLHPSRYPRTDYSTNSDTTAYQPDIG